MRLELEAARAAAKALEVQTKERTYTLNDNLLETKRKLAEAEYELSRERKVRINLEEGILSTLRSQAEVYDTRNRLPSEREEEEEFERAMEGDEKLYPEGEEGGEERDPYDDPPDVLRIRE